MTLFLIGGAIFLLLMLVGACTAPKMPYRHIKKPENVFDLMFPKLEDEPRD